MNVLEGRQLVVLLPHDRDLVSVERRFKKRDCVVCKKLCRYGTRNTIAVTAFRPTERNVLDCLNGAKNIRSAFCLNGHDVLGAPAVQPNIQFVNFYLSVIWDLGSKVILQRIGGDSEKNID